MTREEIYILIGLLERFVADLELCREYNSQPTFSGDDEARGYGDYAERICVYVRTTGDEQVIIDCCKINRYPLYLFGNNTDDVGQSIRKARRYLMIIHDYALLKIWGISQEDIKNYTYYVNSDEGVCRNCATGELLKRPNKNTTASHIGMPRELDTAEAQQADIPDLNEPIDTSEGWKLPTELDTERARKYFARAVEVGYMTSNATNGQWLKAVARLGYMCYKIYSQPRPISALEKYFGVTKLSAAITQAGYEAKRADVKNGEPI